MNRPDVRQSIWWGVAASTLLLLLFSLIVRLLSGSFAQVQLQFNEIGAYLAALSAGFGTQVGVWRFLKLQHKKHLQTHGIPAVSGAASGVAMIACCTHYLATIVPFLGVIGIAGFLTNYQTDILLGSIGLNLLGIAYMVLLVRRHRIHAAYACH